MPATEQTWRNLKTMHVVFGVSAVALLIATLWNDIGGIILRVEERCEQEADESHAQGGPLSAGIMFLEMTRITLS